MYKRLRNYLPQPHLFLLTIFFILLGIFFIARVGMVVYNATNYHVSSYWHLTRAFLMGMRYDAIVACWMLSLPFFVLSFLKYKKIENVKINRGIRVYAVLMIVLALLAVGIDIPYYNFFNSRLNVAAFPRLQNLFLSAAAIKEPKYIPFVFVFIGLSWWLSKIVKKIWETTKHIERDDFSMKKNLIVYSSTGFLLIATMFFRTSDATMERAAFTNDPFVNQVVLNPIFTYTDSFLNEYAIEQTITDSAAITMMQHYLGMKEKQIYTSPIAHKETYINDKKPNIVVILMESMSAERMGWYTKSDTSLTPFLDDLTKKSIFFPRFYSWGIHTYNGIFSTLYGMPYNMLEHPMKNDLKPDSYYGMASILRDNGYSTHFCITHDKEFDNIGRFVPNNGYQHLYDIKSYPIEKWVNDWGVGDETLLDFSIGKMDSLHQIKKPFFMSILTISNHPPFTFPKDTKFRATATNDRDKGFQYADWALKVFFENAAKKAWFKNTVFVLVGDHGVNTPSPWEITTSYNHVPCYIYAPQLLQPKSIKNIGNQIDILPTMMYLTKNTYIHNTVGHNLIKEKRPFVVFSQDHKLCVMNNNFMLIQRKSGKTTLHKYNGYERDTANVLLQHQPLADSMQNYAAAMLRTTKILNVKGLFKKPEPILVVKNKAN
jgi:phosphoglycerol transferase MdoB-like AlkP superfamily enzyme